MNSYARRLLAVTVTSAVVSAPALAFGSAANATTTVQPTGLAGSLLGGVVGGVLGGTTGSTGTLPLPTPVTGILDAITAPVVGAVGSTGGSDSVAGGLDPISAVASTLTDALTSGDPTALVTDITAQLQGVPGSAEALQTLNSLSSGDLQTLSGALLGALPLTDLFGGSVPDPIQAILGSAGASPTDTTGLISVLTTYYQSHGETAPDDAATQALPPSALAALLAALKTPTTPPAPTTKSSTAPTTTATGATGATQPTTACSRATAKVKRLAKRHRIAQRKHLSAQAHSLARRLAKAKKAKKHAC